MRVSLPINCTANAILFTNYNRRWGARVLPVFDWPKADAPSPTPLVKPEPNPEKNKSFLKALFTQKTRYKASISKR